MSSIMTWEEMKDKYPDEWLLIIDFTLDKSGHIVGKLRVEKIESPDSDDIEPANNISL